MAAGVNAKDATLPIGLLRHGLFDDLGPSWLRLDGKTEYLRAAYPEFVAKAQGMPWFLSGTSPAAFRLVKVPAGTATVASGFDALAGSLVGSDKVTLLAAHLPEHAHGYVDDTVETKSGQTGLLGGVLTILSGSTAKAQQKTTAMAGAKTPTPVPIAPPGFVAHLFVFAGRPRK